MGSTEKTDRRRARDDSAAERCPLCSQPVASLDANPAYPFCTPRCQLADLSRWLDEDYRL